jgi:hypothetical protein
MKGRHGDGKDYLLLKRAALSRSSGTWNDDDFDVLANGEVVGRFYKASAAPVHSPWMWNTRFSASRGSNANARLCCDRRGRDGRLFALPGWRCRAAPAGTSLPQSLSVDSLVSPCLELSPVQVGLGGAFLVRLLGCSRGLLTASVRRARPGLPGSTPPPSKAQGNLEDYDAPLIDH